MKHYYLSNLKKALLVCSILECSSYPLFASNTKFENNALERDLVQEMVSFKGKVVDENGNPIADVSIFNGAKSIGKTHSDGTFGLSVAKGSTLTFKSLGHRPHEIKVQQESLHTVIKMHSTERALDEVVVTALGIKREEKSLGYAVSTVKGEQLANAVSSNWMDALSGKVAGLNLMRSGAGPVARSAAGA
jgi:hypothetical protein